MTSGLVRVPKKKIPGIVEFADGTTHEVSFLMARLDVDVEWEMVDVIFHLNHDVICQSKHKKPDDFREAMGKKRLDEIFPYRTFDRSGKEIKLNQPPTDRIIAARDKRRAFIDSMRGSNKCSLDFVGQISNLRRGSFPGGRR